MDGKITEEMRARFRSSFLFSGLASLEEKLENAMLAKTEFFAKNDFVYEYTEETE